MHFLLADIFQDLTIYLYQLLIIGCLLNDVEDNLGTEIENKFINNADPRGTECFKMCKGNPDCDNWTQYYGSCYLKTLGAFKHQRKAKDMKWISGSKNCYSEQGTQLSLEKCNYVTF